MGGWGEKDTLISNDVWADLHNNPSTLSSFFKFLSSST